MTRRAIASVALMCVVSLGPGSGAAVASGATITSVKFAGSAANPTVTIVGGGFGTRPQPAPTFRPRPPQGTVAPYGCTTTGNVGYDYGTQLWLSDGAPGRIWSAGRYRPTIKELDCVGLLVVSYSPTKIVYRLGVDYKAHGYHLSEGNPYQVSVRGATKRGVVHY
jgi:hypothetical protein